MATQLPKLNGRSSLTNEKDHHYFLNRFVCVGEFLMADYANSSSKLSVASRASQCHGVSWWPIGKLALRSLRFLSASQILFFS